MNTAQSKLFLHQRFVLVQPSHPGNVGAAARAIKTMGFSRLLLVNPEQRAIHLDPLALAMASGADDVLQQALIVDSIEEALTGTRLAIALSARPREFGPPTDTPRIAAEYTATLLNHDLHNEIAWIFGNERYGLPNHIVECCQRLVHIPANAEYSSLNLAQAIQLIAYEARIALQAIDNQADHFLKKADPINRARNEDIEAMFNHLEQALVALRFLNPEQPKKLMPRLRQLFARSHLEVDEVNILRGIAKAILQGKYKT